jgi:serine/threonine-protein kinase
VASRSVSAKTLVGTRLGKYRLERLLGRGAFGEVYVGVPASGPQVALKILEASIAHDRDAVARFEREAETARRLEHPGIVRILDVGAQRGRHYIVMELVHGGSFRRYLKKGGAPDKVLTILGDVARALSYAHAQGVVHRDVKPENILLTKARRAKVADFGLARASDMTTMTTDGHMLGTAMYMAPEQASGTRATSASDVYAVGVMIYEAIAGERPFAADTTYALLYQHVEHAPPKPRVRAPYPGQLAGLALRCLAKDPADRPTMAEVAGQLAQATLVRPRRWRRVGLWAAAASAALALVLALHPAVLDPLCGPGFGGGAFRAIRGVAQRVHALVHPHETLHDKARGKKH